VQVTREPLIILRWPRIVAWSRYLQWPLEMTIYEGLIMCRARVGRTQLELRHTKRRVRLTHARFVPPGVGLRTQLSLVGEDCEPAQVAVWWGGREVRRAVAAAGFEVYEEHVHFPPIGKWPRVSSPM
jgi:hypothetical protein